MRFPKAATRSSISPVSPVASSILSTIDADTTSAGDQVFSWGGDIPTAHSVWFEDNGVDTTIVKTDVNGDTTADFQITLLGAGLGLTAADFVPLTKPHCGSRHPLS
jgi:hypothetical protein